MPDRFYVNNGAVYDRTLPGLPHRPGEHGSIMISKNESWLWDICVSLNVVSDPGHWSPHALDTLEDLVKETRQELIRREPSAYELEES